jgi:hypothetical protein
MKIEILRGKKISLGKKKDTLGIRVYQKQAVLSGMQKISSRRSIFRVLKTLGFFQPKSDGFATK